MTNGGPLDSTISMSMYTYKQFGFGNYGYAASMSYIIFVVIAVVTALQFRLLRENTEAHHDRTPHRLGAAGGSTPSSPSPSSRSSRRSCGWCSAASRPRASCARRRPRGGRSIGHARQLHAAVLQARLRHATSPTRSSSRSRSPPATCSSARCSAMRWRCSSSVASGAVRASCMATLMIPGVVTFVPLFVLVANARADQHPSGAVPAVPRRPVRGVPDAAVHPRPAPRPARRGARRRCGRAAHLRADHPAAVRAGPGDAGNPHLPRQLEQLPLAAGRGPVRRVYTLPVALALYSTGQNSTQYGLLLAGATVVVLPMLLVFLVFQRRFIEGIATTGIK